MPYFVYEQSDPRTNEIRYVGQTNNLENRWKLHFKKGFSCNELKEAWYRELDKLSLMPIQRTLEECETRKEAKEIEQRVIKRYLELGYRLTNIHVKGQGKLAAFQRCPIEAAAVLAEHGTLYMYGEEIDPSRIFINVLKKSVTN